MMKSALLILLAVLTAQVILAQNDISPEQLAFFESKIRPVMVDSCYECHSHETGKTRGGLTLDSRDGLIAGGDTGPAIDHAAPLNSLLWDAVSYSDPDYEMPPKQKLPDHIVADFRKWLEMGAPDPRVQENLVVKTEIDIEAGKEFWSFRKPVTPKAPESVPEDWAQSEIDRFIFAKLQDQGLTPAAEAKPAALVRRLYFDLIGLPPAPNQLRRFFEAWKSNPKHALAGTVEELLDSPHFGERWGRHWLDVVRYAESTGKEINMTFPHAWRYRDYVIDSFNQDKPYGRFLEEQIAGDLLAIKNDFEWHRNLIATGFLACGVKSLNTQSPRQFQMDLADEQIDTLSRAFLGLTVSCARCHDHKFDPIPTADYYAMAGIFLSTETFFGTVPGIQNRRSTDLLLLPIPDSEPIGEVVSQDQIARDKERLADMERELGELRLQARRERMGQAPTNSNPNFQRQIIRLTTQSNFLRAQLAGLDADGVPKSFAMGVQDRSRPTEATILLRGEIDKPAQTVRRGFLQVLDTGTTPPMPANASGRRELARWIASEDNPLTARVMVNRIWKHLFGAGIVTSLDNFGTTGQAPTHPELLDYLAVRFMENQWSIKNTIREIVLSRAYRLSSDHQADNYAKDPDNRYLWRANQRQLDAESLRDAMLVISNKIDISRPRASAVARAGDAAIGRFLSADNINTPSLHRSVYLPVMRDNLPEALALFDFSDPSMVTGARETTNVPSQALYLMNNPFVLQQAEAMGRHLLENFDDPKRRVGYAFLQTYGRPPTGPEIQSCIQFFRTFMPKAGRQTGDRQTAERLALTTFCQSLLSSAEFRFLN